MNRALSRFMNKNKNKGQKVDLPKVRSLEEIKKEYAEISLQYAQHKYKAAVYSRAADKLEALMERLNNEGEERQKLDFESAKALADLKKSEEKPTESGAAQ